MLFRWGEYDDEHPHENGKLAFFVLVVRKTKNISKRRDFLLYNFAVFRHIHVDSSMTTVNEKSMFRTEIKRRKRRIILQSNDEKEHPINRRILPKRACVFQDFAGLVPGLAQ